MSLPVSTPSPDRGQKENRSWWTENPMTYDWEKTIRAPEGSPEFFQQCDQRAIEAHRPFGHPAHPADAPYSQLIPWAEMRGKRVLEIGCGMGLHASLFAGAGACVVTMDLTTRASRLARKRFDQSHNRANVIQADGEKLPFPDACFDHVWSWGVIHHSHHTETIAREVHRVLKPGGRFQCMVYHRTSVRYWIIGGIQHGLLRGKLLRMSLEDVNQTFTDGAIARHYTRNEFRDVLADFNPVRFRILQEAGSDAIPKISPILRKTTPSLAARIDSWVDSRFGWFLFAEATKPQIPPS